MASLASVVFVVAIAVAVAVVAAAVAEEMLVLVSTPPLAVLSLSPSPNLSFDVVAAVAAGMSMLALWALDWSASAFPAEGIMVTSRVWMEALGKGDYSNTEIEPSMNSRLMEKDKMLMLRLLLRRPLSRLLPRRL